jgi:phosphoglycerate dehydrogenase-like enzyme
LKIHFIHLKSRPFYIKNYWFIVIINYIFLVYYLQKNMKLLFLWDIDIEYILKNIWNFSYETNYLNNSFESDFIIIRWSNFILDSSYLSNFLNLKWIYVLSVWVDNIDVKYCSEKNIFIENDTKSSIYSVAELAVSMFILALRNWFSLWTKLKNWVYTRIPLWNNISWKKIWVLWYWNIGKSVIRLLNLYKQFTDFEIYVFDSFSWVYDEYLHENNIKICYWINNLFEMCEYIFIHVNLSDETHNLFNYEVFYLNNIKWLVNLSRKWIVNENDLLLALNDNKIDFYVSDVVDWEPNIVNINTSLINHEKVFILPHIWANTFQVQKQILDNFIIKFNSKH